MELDLELRVAVRAVLDACRLARSVRADLISSETAAKADRSPVTVADFGVQALICLDLSQAFPSDPIMAEEDAAGLRPSGEAAGLKAGVLERVLALRPGLDEEQILEAVDLGRDQGGPYGRRWILDPIDGTKGFVRGDQYAVALSLLREGRVVLGVLGCPNLPARIGQDHGPPGRLFAAVKGQGAFMRPLDDPAETPIRTSPVTDPAGAVFCESVESEHVDHEQMALIRAALGAASRPVRMDSQCKYAAVARGDSSVYLRLPRLAGQKETAWDHAAGSLIVTEAGGLVSDLYGRPLDFSSGRSLAGNFGIAASAAGVHAEILKAVKEVLAAER